MRKAVCVIVKDERRHITEWIAYQFMIGFNTVIVLDNNSTDGTRDLVLGFANAVDVRLIDWPDTSTRYQMNGYMFVCQTFKQDFDWIAFVDSDEFLVPLGSVPIETLLNRNESSVAIGVNWLCFGSSGLKHFNENLVIETFTRRAFHDFPPNLHVKSIVRPDRVIGASNPHYFDVVGNYVDVLGRPMVWGESRGVSSRFPSDGDWFVHHYFVRSLAHWREKMARGHHDGTVRRDDEFVAYDRNEVLDENAVKTISAVRQVMAMIASTA